MRTRVNSTGDIGASRWEQRRDEMRAEGDDSEGWWTDHIEDLDALAVEDAKREQEREAHRDEIIADNLAAVKDWDKFYLSTHPQED